MRTRVRVFDVTPISRGLIRNMKRNTKTQSPLQLSRQTLRDLTNAGLSKVVGGLIVSRRTGDSCTCGETSDCSW